MILGIEVGLLVYGVIALFNGKFAVSKTRAVFGWPARLLGLVAMSLLPACIMVGLVIGVVLVIQQGPDAAQQFARNQVATSLIEFVVVIIYTLLLFVIANFLAVEIDGEPSTKRKKKKPEYEIATPSNFDDLEEVDDDESPYRRPRR